MLMLQQETKTTLRSEKENHRRHPYHLEITIGVGITAHQDSIPARLSHWCHWFEAEVWSR